MMQRMLLLAAAGCALFDAASPSLTVSVPPVEGPRAGPVAVSMEAFDDGAGLGQVRVAVDGEVVHRVDLDAEGRPASWSGTWRLETAGLEDGAHQVEVVAADASRRGNPVQRVLSITTDNTPPVITLARRSLSARQGGTLAVYVRADAPPEALSLEVNGAPATLHRLEASAPTWRALVGVPIRTEPGSWPLVVEAADAAGNTTRREEEVAVAEHAFRDGGVVYLSAANQREMADREGYAAAKRLRDVAYATPGGEQLWSGPFLRPAQGRVSSSFGHFRTYNTGKRSYHDALDIANEPGTPILAAADGRVTLARSLHTFGGAIMLTHGQGVTTTYSHMSKLLVEEGEAVTRGQRIGLMGSTGLSTGPHLHWGLVLYQGEVITVDPVQWEADDFGLAPALEFF